MTRRQDIADLVAALRRLAVADAPLESEAITALIGAAVQVAGGDPDLIDHLYDLLRNTLADLDAL